MRGQGNAGAWAEGDTLTLRIWEELHEEEIKCKVYVNCGNRHCGDCRMFYYSIL